MPDKAYFDAKLAELSALLASGQIDDAYMLLDGLMQQDDLHLTGHPMGERTALRLPRRLHSALLKLAKAEGNIVSRVGYQYLLVPPPEALEPYGRFSAGERRVIAAKNREAVPKVIHQIWIGTRPVPVAAQAWERHAQANGYTYRLWREADLEREAICSNPVFARMLADGDYPGAVDVARYVILARFGGVYLDCDFYPARDDLSFDDVLPMIGLTAFGEDVPRKTGRGSLLLANSFIAAPPGHPVFTRMLDAFPKIIAALPKAPAWWATGPLIFTVVARSGAISLANADFVVTTLPDLAPFSDVEKARKAAHQTGEGLLIAWKSW